MKKIGFDVDDVLAQFLKKVTKRYNEIHPDYLIEISDFENFDCYKCKNIKYPKTIIEDIFNESDFYDHDIEIVKHSREVIEELQKSFEIYVISNAMSFPASMMSKFNWVKRNFLTIDHKHIIFTADKSLINVDFLVDDSSHNFENNKAFGILFDAPHNQEENRYHRCYSFYDVFKFLQGFKNS